MVKSKSVMAAVIILLVILVAVLYRIIPIQIKKVERYHGPDPEVMVEIIKKEGVEEVLGRSVKRPTKKVTPTPTKTITVTPTPSIRATPVPTLAPSTGVTADFGIAAGGKLIYFSQTDLDKYFTNLQDLGVKWVRWDVDWHVIQYYGPTQYDWKGADRVVSTANKYGIKMLGTIAYSPSWAIDATCTNSWGCPPSSPQAFGKFTREVALRYKDSIKHWEIWNEQNNSSFWGPELDMNKYVAILKEAYTEIKLISPDSTVMIGGLAITGYYDGTLPVNYVKTLYSLGANKYFDAVAVHPYTYPFSPTLDAYWNWWLQVSEIHQFMVTKQEGGKKIWITEYGTATGGPGQARSVNYVGFKYHYDYMTEAAQTQLLKETTTLYKQNSSWMGPFFWYSLLDDGTAKTTPENFFGLLRNDWSKKPAYTAYKEIIAK